MTEYFKPVWGWLFLMLLLVVIGGCSPVSFIQPATLPQLTSDQEQQLGRAVASRLIQILGGRLYDEELDKILRESGTATGSHFSVVDRRAAEVYPLPGQYIIFTRGLLTRLENLEQFEQLLSLASTLSRNAYRNHAKRIVAQATTEYFAGNSEIYDLRAPDIRLAEYFANVPCTGVCLDEVFATAGSRRPLPEPVEGLNTLIPGYELLEQARQLEKSEEQSRAIAAYLQAATVAPDNARILSELGMAYMRAGDLHSASLHLGKADKLVDSSQTKMGLGYIALNTGKIKQAEYLLAESVTLLPVIENLFLLAEAREKNADVESARLLYRIVADNDRNGKLGRTSLNRLRLIKDSQ